MRFFRWILLLPLLVLAAACSGDATPVAVNDTENPVPQADIQVVADATFDPANEGLVARVNGEPITRAAYDEMLSRINNPDVADPQALARQALDILIEQELIRQGAPALGVNITDADVEAEMASLREAAGDNWANFLQQNNFTEETMFRAQRESLLTRAVRDQLIAPYLVDVEQVNARHILVLELSTAEEVLTRLNAGEGFATLAAEYSIDTTTSTRGGNLGWFARNELFLPSLEALAFDLESNQMAGPIASPLGYHIIQTLDKKVAPIESERLPILQENVYNTWIEEQYRQATIDRYVQW